MNVEEIRQQYKATVVPVLWNFILQSRLFYKTSYLVKYSICGDEMVRLSNGANPTSTFQMETINRTNPQDLSQLNSSKSTCNICFVCCRFPPLSFFISVCPSWAVAACSGFKPSYVCLSCGYSPSIPLFNESHIACIIYRARPNCLLVIFAKFSNSPK